ncbi:hypothetical protein E1A91_D09G089900v1 [Gossypium mustelinum]|uniref:valine--tRNA ligase n=1 Tax=Gossypium mustelinum TaxID=34275 RepID=A0A5D2TJI9_GOSMU|nr:hypothetical protein E1A91_D09G089900v1 [Gossypium mustelinum]
MGFVIKLVVERMLASEGIKRVELGRDGFEKRVWEWKEKNGLGVLHNFNKFYFFSFQILILMEYGGTITNQIKRLGASCDWTRECFTLDEQLSRAVIEAFIKLHEKGLIYQDSSLETRGIQEV